MQIDAVAPTFAWTLPGVGPPVPVMREEDDLRWHHADFTLHEGGDVLARPPIHVVDPTLPPPALRARVAPVGEDELVLRIDEHHVGAHDDELAGRRRKLLLTQETGLRLAASFLLEELGVGHPRRDDDFRFHSVSPCWEQLVCGMHASEQHNTTQLYDCLLPHFSATT